MVRAGWARAGRGSRPFAQGRARPVQSTRRGSKRALVRRTTPMSRRRHLQVKYSSIYRPRPHESDRTGVSSSQQATAGTLSPFLAMHTGTRGEMSRNGAVADVALYSSSAVWLPSMP